MRSRRRNPIYSRALLTVAVTVGAIASPAVVRADGDAVDPGVDAGLPPADPLPLAPLDESEPEPETSPETPTTTEPADSDAPAGEDPASESDAPATTVPTDEPAPSDSLPAVDPDLPAGATQPSTDSPAPTTTVPTVEPLVLLDEAALTPVAESISELDAQAAAAAAFAAFPDGIVRPISFPVLGPVEFSNDWGACRDDCTRYHEGTDVIGVRMQPLLAAVDGTVTHIEYANVGLHGVDITVTGADGWYYNYFHVNNDTPGTDDGSASPEWQMSPLVTVGSRVSAGQVIAYMGDSGNAEGSVPHLHFEIRQPDRTPVNPYPSLVAARQRQTCSGNDDGLILSPEALTLSPTVIAVIPIDGGGRWLIEADGRVYAEGSADHVSRMPGVKCAPTEPVAKVAIQPLVELPVIPAPAIEPASASLPTDRRWTVESGQSLWMIVQKVYGVSDGGRTSALVALVFDHNRDQLNSPSLINVGMELLLPAVPA